jgi:hypothetical protein
MKIRTRIAGAVAGTAVAGLAAFAVGTATPAGAQQAQLTKPAVSTATPLLAPHDGWSCWDDDCGWWDDDWDSWGWGW